MFVYLRRDQVADDTDCLFNCSRKGLYRRLPQTATLGLVAFLFCYEL